MFTHLHLHTNYSLLDGLIHIKKLGSKLKESGMTACAMTDHGVMYGVYDFYSACKESGVKPIYGCEVYVAPRSRFDKDPKKDKKRYHLTLLAQNLTGYHNLIKIVSAGHLDGFYTKPRVDREILEKYSEGIIATSGCAASPVNRNLLHNNKDLAYAWAEFFKEIFPGRFFVEIQRNGIPECENAIPSMLELAKYFNLDVVATCDSHYLNKEDSNIQEVSFCIRDAKLLSDENRQKKWSDEFYVKTHDEMVELFKDIPEAVENTQKVADMVESFSIKYDRVQPTYEQYLKVGYTPQTELREITYNGIIKRYLYQYRKSDNPYLQEILKAENPSLLLINYISNPDLYNNQLALQINIPNSDKIWTLKELINRTNYELKVIHDKGYDDYFLVVADFLNWSKANGIAAGVRGSVGGAITAYLTGISDICPLRWELYFERFLNPERSSPPDIDSDLQADKRHLVVDYIQNKYGKENCSLILALGKLTTRSAIRDVCRVMGISLVIADKLSKMVPVLFGKVYKMKKVMDEVPEFKTEIEKDEKLIKMVEIVKKIEDMPRQTGVHACGMIITPKPIVEYVALQHDKEGRVTAQLEMKPVEELGLMKFDILGLENLGIISHTLELIEKYKHVKLDILNITHNDKTTFELLQKGDTDAVFQLESEGMKKYLKELRPTNVDDICFMCAAYRPGPMQYITPYINRKYGKEKVTYLIPEMESIVSDTFGFAIYQEQVIRIAVDIGGYTMGEADMLRRAMGKKVKEIMDKEGEKFVLKCLAKGFTEEIANKLFDYMKPFADYGFNKSHSAGYAMIAYQTAYLKANYPVEFLAGVMQTDLEDSKKIKRDVIMAKKMNISILPPDINKSAVSFAIENGSVRFGLGGIKGSSRKLAELIIEERLKNGDYTNLDDVVFRVGAQACSKSNMELLIKVGVFDNFGNRAQLLEVLPIILNKYIIKKSDTNQVDMFGLLNSAKTSNEFTHATATFLPQKSDLEDKIKISTENEALGTFFSTHPLLKFNDRIDNVKFICLESANTQNDGTRIRGIFLLQKAKKILTKKDKKPMIMCKVEDFTGEMDAVLFTSAYEKLFPNGEINIKEGDVYIFEGKVNSRDSKLNSDDNDEMEITKSLMLDNIQVINELVELDKYSNLKNIKKYEKNIIEEKNIEDEVLENIMQNSDNEEYIPPAYDSNSVVDNSTSNIETQAITKDEKHKVRIDLRFEEDKSKLQQIKELLMNNKGYVEVSLLFRSGSDDIEKKMKDGIDEELLKNENIRNYIVT